MAKWKQEKRKKHKNPLLEKKFIEGEEYGVKRATAYFIQRFEELKKEKGIGPKTAEKIWRVMFQIPNERGDKK